MNKNEITPEKLAKMIDQTLLKPYVTLDDLREHCEKAKEYNFKTVAINNAPVPFCKKVLEGSDVLCDAAVSFPLGQCTIDTKVFEAKDVIEKGAGEVDYVVNIVELKSGNWDYVEEEMRRIVEACNEKGVTSKEDVKLMKSCVGDAVKIKAAGGIRDYDTAMAMIEAGASRIGTSAGVKIVDECRARMAEK